MFEGGIPFFVELSIWEIKALWCVPGGSAKKC